MAYADGIVILATKANLITAMKKIEEAANNRGLELNEAKTKFMLIRRTAKNMEFRGLKIRTVNYNFDRWTILTI